MPRNTQNIYQLPPQSYGVAGEIIISARYNTVLDDFVQEFNSPRPVSAGGTGSTNAEGARTALSVPSIAELEALSNTVTGLGNTKLNISGGTLTGSLTGTTADFPGGITGNLAGTATTAAALATARTIALTGGVTGSTLFDGSGNVSIPATIAPNSHSHSIANITGLQALLDNTVSKNSPSTIAPTGSIGGSGLVDMGGFLTLSGRAPNLIFSDISAGQDDYFIHVNGGVFRVGQNIAGTPTSYLVFDGENFTYLGNQIFHAGNFNPDTKLDVSANAASASKWATPRTISLTGDVTGTATFDGSGNFSIATTSTTTGVNAHTHPISQITGLQNALNSKLDLSGGTLTGELIGTSANFAAGITANLTGDVTGNAGTATALATPRTIALTGGVTGSALFDGSGNVTIAATVQNFVHTHPISQITGLQGELDNKSNLNTVNTFNPDTASGGLGLVGIGEYINIRGFAPNIVFSDRSSVANDYFIHTNTNIMTIGQMVDGTPTGFLTLTPTSLNYMENSVFHAGNFDPATKQDTLNADQIRKITISAAAPSGGVDGDIWLQH